MILGFLGSAFAPSLAAATGIGALASPLLAGAIGSGVGRAVETGDIGAGLRTGIGSFIGGKILGSAMNGSGAGTEGGLLGGFTGGAPVAPGMTTGTPLAVPAEGIGALMPPTGAPAASGGLFQSGALGSGMRRGMDFMSSAEGIGSQLGGSLLGGAMSRPKPTVSLPAQTTAEGPAEMQAIPRQQNIAPTGYRPGVDPEFNYGVSTPYSYEDIIGYRDTGVLPYAEGGEVQMPNEKTEIVDAIKAIKGLHAQPELALGAFLAKYGEEALRNLVDSVESGELDETVERFASGERGMVKGPGDDSGTDDKVPATIDGEQDLLLTDGEFVMRKSATDALEKKFGGGFLSEVNKAGDGAPEVIAKRMAA
jgi:hypothetical protein